MPPIPPQLDHEPTSAESLEAERVALEARRRQLAAEQAILEAELAAKQADIAKASLAARQAELDAQRAALAAKEDAARQATALTPPPSAEIPPDPVLPGAPLTFVPHDAEGHPVPPRVQIRSVLRAGRFGDLEEHDLIRILDSIEDELARRRFRESVYISVFVWLIVVGLLFFGPKYLWHAPQLISPAEALKQQDVLTTLTNPVLPHHASPAPKLDSGTLKKLRAMTPKPTPPAPTEAPTPQPTPAPSATSQPTPVPPTPQPIPPTPSPVPRSSAPPIADAPLPQPATRPNFSTPNTASDSMRDLANNLAKNRGGGSGIPMGTGTHGNGRGASVGQGVDILSDTKGVDFQPYLARIMREIYEEWIPLIPEEARPPLSKQGVTQIRFTINPDGTIAAMHLDGSTHDVALDRAAWGSITGVGQFPPLPKQFTGPNLELRIHYLVNTNKE
jgi:TonB family protein